MITDALHSETWRVLWVLYCVQNDLQFVSKIANNLILIFNAVFSMFDYIIL